MPALVAFSLGLAALLGAVEALAVVRAWLPAIDPADRPALTALGGAAGIAATIVAWDFFATAAPEPRRWAALRMAVAVGVVAVPFALAVATAPTAPIGNDPDAVTPHRLAARLMLAVALGALVLGAGLVVLPRLWRALRLAGGRSMTGWSDALIEAFAPSLGGRRAAASERAKLAADLHARVVPELRRAVATAAATPATDPLVTDTLRAALDDVEALMVERHSVLLETFGLVAALEWLAERTQERAGVEVTLDVDDAGSADPADARPPRAVERSAFRVALLATDNAVRHAPGARIALRAVARPAAVRVEIADAGPGFDVEAARARASERRGLTDMAAEAATVGARLVVRSGENGGDPGTRVTFEWPTG